MPGSTHERSRAFTLALGGICLALTLVLLFAAGIVPGVELTLFAIASLSTAVMIIETGVWGGALLYGGACLLGLIILPNKLVMIPYIFFFGYYGILKYFIEKIKAPLLQILCKCAFFALLLCVALLGFSQLIAGSLRLPDYPFYILIPAGILFLLLYDWVFTFLINFYFRRFKGAGSDRLKLS